VSPRGDPFRELNSGRPVPNLVSILTELSALILILELSAVNQFITHNESVALFICNIYLLTS
jgi:hypothetical protein